MREQAALGLYYQLPDQLRVDALGGLTNLEQLTRHRKLFLREQAALGLY